MSDVYRAITLSFLTACLYLGLSAAAVYLEIHLLSYWDQRYSPDDSLSMNLATSTLLASLLCVWVLLVTAFARKYVSRLRPGISFAIALSVALPLVLMGRLLPLIDPEASWSPGVTLLFSLLWSSLGLYGLLWYLTPSEKTDE